MQTQTQHKHVYTESGPVFYVWYFGNNLLTSLWTINYNGVLLTIRRGYSCQDKSCGFLSDTVSPSFTGLSRVQGWSHEHWLRHPHASRIRQIFNWGFYLFVNKFSVFLMLAHKALRFLMLYSYMSYLVLIFFSPLMPSPLPLLHLQQLAYISSSLFCFFLKKIFYF